MGAELSPRPEAAPRGVVGATVGLVADGVRYGVLLVQLGAAAVAVRSLSESVRGAYQYVEGCAESVDRLAETASSMSVEPAVVAAHHDAATVMRSALEEADAMAEAAADLAVLFDETADAHRADYGPVHEAMTSKPGQIADSPYYSNR